MTLFAPDLYRFFGLGFAGGALVLAAVNAEHVAADLAPAAEAAEAPAPAPVHDIAPEFVIQEFDEGDKL